MMAIARQEFEARLKVKSPVGARLMQIMPGTATHTVKMFSIPGYSSPKSTVDPDTNINIGTSYLQYVYQQFGNRIFASAAYNAGPGRVRTGWASAQVGSMPWRLSKHSVLRDAWLCEERAGLRCVLSLFPWR